MMPDAIPTGRTGTSGGAILAAGAVCLAAGVIVGIARFATPDPAVVIAAAVLVVLGFTLAANGVLRLLSRPITTEGTVRDRRWTVSGVRRVGVVVLDVGAAEPLVVQVEPAIYATIAVGNRVRVRHDSLNRARVHAVEILDPAP